MTGEHNGGTDAGSSPTWEDTSRRIDSRDGPTTTSSAPWMPASTRQSVATMTTWANGPIQEMVTLDDFKPPLPSGLSADNDDR